MKQISNPLNADSSDESDAISDINGDEERESNNNGDKEREGQHDDTEFVSTENKRNNLYPLTSSLGIDVIELLDSQIQQAIDEQVDL